MCGFAPEVASRDQGCSSKLLEKVHKFMHMHGFKVDRCNTITYFHTGKRIRLMVHGDDFIRSSLDWLKTCLEKRFEVKSQIIGHGATGMQKGRVLNRIIWAFPSGWCDQRHAELITRTLNCDASKAVVIPGEDANNDKEEEESHFLEA